MPPDPALPSLAAARSMTFEQLGKALRHFVDHHVGKLSAPIIEQATQLVLLLEEKIPFPIPNPPSPPALPQPVAPRKVQKPAKPVIDETPEITRCKEKYEKQIAALRVGREFRTGKHALRVQKQIQTLFVEMEQRIAELVTGLTFSSHWES